MDSTLISGLFAATIAVTSTVAVERLGGRIGGLVASLPSTIVPATLGFWWASNASGGGDNFADALFMVPVGMLVNAAFLSCWRVLPSRLSGEEEVGSSGLKVLLFKVALMSLMVWTLCAALLIGVARSGLVPVFWLGSGCLVLQIGAGIWGCWDSLPAPKGKQPVSPVVLLSRGVLAGCAIAFSVWLAGVGVPLLAGMASVFPAIFMTTMVSVWLSQGKAVPVGAVGPIMLGSSSVSLYAIASVWTLPALGGGAGAFASWLISAGFVALPAWRFLRWRAGVVEASG